MFDWARKLAGTMPFHNKVGLDDRSLQLLCEDFAPLDELASGISKRVIRYLLDADGDEVLAEIATLGKAAETLHLRCVQQYYGGDGITPRSEFFKSTRCGSPEFFRRLGLVYQAGSRQAKLHLIETFGDPKLNWLEILLIEATQLSMYSWPRRCRPCSALTADMVEAMIELEGLPRDLLVRAAYMPEPAKYYGPALEPVFAQLAGMDQSAVRHRQTLVAGLDSADFKKRVYALTMMMKCHVPPGEFIDRLVALALDSSKQVRELAAMLLVEVKSDALPLLERKAIEGVNEERATAACIIWRWEGEKARAFLTSRAEQEKNKKVALVIRDFLDPALAEPVQQETKALKLPPLPIIPDRLPLSSETELAWSDCFNRLNAAVGNMLADIKPCYYKRHLKAASSDAIRKGFAMLQGDEKTEKIFDGLFYLSLEKDCMDAMKAFWQRPGLHLVHFVRFLIMVGALHQDERHEHGVLAYGYWLESLLPVFRRAHPDAGLRELAAAFQASNLDPCRLGNGLLKNHQEKREPFGMPSSQVWPYWEEHLDILVKALEPISGDFMMRWNQKQSRRNAFHAISTFPQPPASLTQQLWDLALGPKTERALAQRCLETLPDKVNRLVAALTSSSSESRQAAAEWLSRIGDKGAVTPLMAALRKEKNEITKGAMMTALEQLGVPVEQFLDWDSLLKESVKGLAKGVPADLKWFPFDRLPEVHWKENGKLVEPEIVRWWLIQGFKLKSPEPSPLLRKYCASLKTSDREMLGQFVLEAWLGEDTIPIPRAAAEQLARQQAQQFAQLCQSNYWPKNSPKKSLEEFYDDFLPGLLMQPKGSAISSKGILSLAGACAGSEAAHATGRYLKQWYGMRVAQCRALVQMLAWVEHKTATQLLLAVGSRFRTKSIQEEAVKQARALAERKGWTVAELADRTIPTAGLDENGGLVLDFGPRQFTVKLSETLEFALVDAHGTTLKSLPEPGKADNESMAAAAKKSFQAAKKELKSVLAMQRDRFYEAMCAQRRWPSEDWNVYLNRHPIARHLCQRLVWAVIRDEKTVSLFRPLPDGSLTDNADDPVTLRMDDIVCVAHECLVTPEQSPGWRQHLMDYNVEPLFEQFGRSNFALSEERKQEDELSDFQGHILEAFKLRGRANKLGYTRGQPQDGGWFYEYRKRFPSLGIEAVIEFTGNGLPEENRTVALTSLHFEHIDPTDESATGGSKMLLGQLPPVLLCECWNDIRQMAAEGPGFEPQWEQKTQL